MLCFSDAIVATFVYSMGYVRAGRSEDRIPFRRDFPHPSRMTLGPTVSYTIGTGSLSPGVKRSGRGVDHAPSSSAKVKERVELYIFSTLGLRGLFWGEFYV